VAMLRLARLAVTKRIGAAAAPPLPRS